MQASHTRSTHPLQRALQEAKRGAGGAAVFIARNRFAVLDRAGNQILVKNLRNEVTRQTPCPLPVTDNIFYAGTGLLLCRSDEKVQCLAGQGVLQEQQQELTQSDDLPDALHPAYQRGQVLSWHRPSCAAPTIRCGGCPLPLPLHNQGQAEGRTGARCANPLSRYVLVCQCSLDTVCGTRQSKLVLLLLPAAA